MVARWRHIAVTFCAIALSGCAPPVVPVRTIAPNALVDSTGSRIVVQANVAPERVIPVVLELMVDAGWPVGNAQGGIIEAKLPPQVGWTGTYDITVRGFVTPTERGSRVVLQAEERGVSQYGANVKPITKMNEGRSGQVWKALEAMAAKLAERFRS